MNGAPDTLLQENRYKLLFTQMVDGMALHQAVCSPEGALLDFTIIEVNPAFERITGLSAAELAGRSVRETLSGFAPELIVFFENVYTSGVPQTFEQPHKEDTFLSISAFSPAAGLLACVVSDITYRKQVEDALRESESTFRAHVENSFDVIFTLDATGNFIFVSPAWERHFGFPPSEVMGKSFAPTVHPDDFQPCVDFLTRILSTGQSGTSPVYRVKCADGSYRSFVANGMPYLDTKGQLLFIGVGHDVSEQLRAEEARLEFERQLLHTQKLESLGVLAGGIAHDFNNLLLTILGNIELASLNITPRSKTSRLLEQATVAAKRAADLTNRLLAYSGKGIYFANRINLNQMVEENSIFVRTAVPRTITIDQQLADSIPDIMGDRAQIQQVVMNLITNAAEAVESLPGGVKISTGLMNCTDSYLSGSRLKEKPTPGQYVYVEVNDNGIGMSDDVQARIFDPFFTTKFTGRGLGMSAVLGIVQAHSGALMLASAPGAGTTIRVLFPVANDLSAAEGGMESDISIQREAADSTLSGTVLIVDDEKPVLKICSTMVKLCGLSVITAADGSAAVNTFRRRHDEIDLVIMDLTMPNMDGVAAMLALREIKPDVKIILSSGYSDQELDERISGQHPSGFVRKPYTLHDLETELRRVLLP